MIPYGMIQRARLSLLKDGYRVAGDEIKRIPYLFMLTKKVMHKVNVNIVAGMIINITAVILSSAGILNPVTGALWHNFGSVFVVINAALLLQYKDK